MQDEVQTLGRPGPVHNPKFLLSQQMMEYGQWAFIGSTRAEDTSFCNTLRRRKHGTIKFPYQHLVHNAFFEKTLLPPNFLDDNN